MPSIIERPRQKISGFSLLEIAIVLFIVALLAGTTLSGLTRSINERRKDTTRARLQAIENALVQYVAQYGRLPCPADGTVPAGQPAAGADAGCTNQAKGVVPWLSLGLTEADTLDGWNARITYRVDPALAAASGKPMDLTQCDPGGTRTGGAGSCTPATAPPCTTQATCFHFNEVLKNRGLQIRKADGVTVTQSGAPSALNGAAFVLISHGDNSYGAYSAEGVLQDAPSHGTQEANNANGPAKSLTAATFFVSDLPDYTETATHFDDLVRSPTIFDVATRAGVGPRPRPPPPPP